MLRTDNVEVELILESIPALSGSLGTLEEKIYSSLHTANQSASDNILNQEAFSQNLKYQLLFDPQTSGGLLASVAPELAETCLSALHSAGYAHANEVGRVSKLHGKSSSIILK